MMPFKHITSPVTLKQAMQATETAQEAATTIALRWPVFFYDVVDPTHPMSAETQRAFSEKAAAAMEGSVAIMQAWQRLWIDIAFGRVSTSNLPAKVVKIAEAGAAPARKRVKANARRLTRKQFGIKT